MKWVIGNLLLLYFYFFIFVFGEFKIEMLDFIFRLRECIVTEKKLFCLVSVSVVIVIFLYKEVRVLGFKCVLFLMLIYIFFKMVCLLG